MDDDDRDPGRRMVLSFADVRRRNGPPRVPRPRRASVRALYWLLLAIGLAGLARNGWRDWREFSQETGAARSQQQPTTTHEETR